jgi:hypothetical protein
LKEEFEEFGAALALPPVVWPTTTPVGSESTGHLP